MYAIFFDFQGETIRLPVNPSEIKVAIKSRNKTVELINIGEASIQKTPGLREYTFQALLPGKPYRFVHTTGDFRSAEFYLNRFGLYTVSKKPVRFVVNRVLPNGETIFEENLEVTFEDYTVNEKAGEEGDFYADIKLREYRLVQARVLKAEEMPQIIVDTGIVIKITEEIVRAAKEPAATYQADAGDSPWSVAKKGLNDETKAQQVSVANDIPVITRFETPERVKLQNESSRTGGHSNGGGGGRYDDANVTTGGGGFSNGGGGGRNISIAQETKNRAVQMYPRLYDKDYMEKVVESKKNQLSATEVKNLINDIYDTYGSPVN